VFLYMLVYIHMWLLLDLQVAIKELAYELFHEHKQPSDQTMKDRLKEKLENDEYCASWLQKMHEKGVSFDHLWDDRLYSLVST
jgi:hypothetical protein